jgi:hypothetical protein
MCRVVRYILRVLTSRCGGALRVLWQTVLCGRVRVGMLRRGRTLLVLLVHDARRSRLLEVVRRRTLLGVVGVMLLGKRDVSNGSQLSGKVKRGSRIKQQP